MHSSTLSAQPGFRSFVYTSQGARPYQQDRHTHCGRTDSKLAKELHSPVVAAVFDGHGTEETGHLTADLCSRTFLPTLHEHPVWNGIHDNAASLNPVDRVRLALTDTVNSLESLALQDSATNKHYSGCTLCAAVIVSSETNDVKPVKSCIVTANVGDSRSVAAHGVWGSQVKAADLTVDHVPTHPVERKRIENAGGWVVDRMLNGYIGMSRAIGDNDLKQHRNITKFSAPAEYADRARNVAFASDLFVATPEVSAKTIGDDMHFVVVASDGIWHVLSSQDAIDVVYRQLLRGTYRNPAKALVSWALKRGAQDNITAFVLLLSRQSLDAVHAAASLSTTSRFRVKLSRQVRFDSRISSSLHGSAVGLKYESSSGRSTHNDRTALNVSTATEVVNGRMGISKGVLSSDPRRVQSNLESSHVTISADNDDSCGSANPRQHVGHVTAQVPTHDEVPGTHAYRPKRSVLDPEEARIPARLAATSRAESTNRRARLKSLFSGRASRQRSEIVDDQTLHGANNYPGDRKQN